MTIDSRKVTTTYIYMIINIIFFIFIFLNYSNITLKLLAFLAIIQLVVSIFYIVYNTKKVFSLIVIFLIISFFFNFGQILVIAFNLIENYTVSRSVLALTSEYTYIKAGIYVIISHFFLTLAFVFSYNAPGKKLFKKIYNTDEETTLKRLKLIAISLIIITVIPSVYYDVSKIYALKLGGYLNTFEVEINKYIIYLAQFFRPSIIVLLISLKNKKNSSRIVFFVSTVYYLLMMLSGDRGTNMIFLIANIYVYYSVISKIKIKTTIMWGICGYLLLWFMSTLSMFRASSDISYRNFVEILSLKSADNMIFSSLREFGDTFKTLCFSIDFIPSYSEYNYGRTYIIGWLNIFPKLPSELAEYLKNDFTFVNAFPYGYNTNIGGSYLAELYYNFGIIGSVFTFFIGLLIGFVNNLIEKCIYTKNWLYFSICMIAFPSLLLWVRGYYVELFIKVGWLGLYITFFYNLKNNSLKNNYKKG